ncbi:AMP nucleosidase [Parvularcula maris]|uniref:AMP nucleosidase n=1 Tax=Parvularcula maris TaxID=2965077 RepID=A0A9X2L863_9PROT|nr:AMP nucleosidase [Parvularcula maris]MCQ8184719.1 AMP nucleosidase [Parvularcula maris]
MPHGLPDELEIDRAEVMNGAEAAADRLTALYEEQVEIIRERFDAFVAGRAIEQAKGYGVYPCIHARISAEKSTLTSSLALGQVASEHAFATAVTHPRLFRSYFIRQLSKVIDTYGAEITVGLSNRPIPLPFAMEAATANLTEEQRDALQRHFFTPDLVSTNDDIVDGKAILDRSGPLPLSMFTAERTDYSLNRIRHYTATDPEHFQPFVLLTNYQRYVDEFVIWAKEEVSAGRAELLVEPGGRVTGADGEPSAPPAPKLPQMPAYHLVRKGQRGVTLVNIGVGPSNAKTITDHLAVLRPHVWLMIGHCGGLRRTQRLGDYVLAHAYLREDRVLDHALPPSIPLPTLAEVQLALSQAVSDETGLSGAELKQHLRTGTVVTTDDRNWELRFEELAVLLNQSRAIAIDMESATVAAAGYRYRVPYGTLLCVSDRPIHGEIKLPGMANAFYQARVGQHLKIGLRTLELLRSEADKGSLHSRKLRSFDEPLFR